MHRLAEVSHRTWIRQAVRDKGENEAELSKDVAPHDLERAEDTVQSSSGSVYGRPVPNPVLTSRGVSRT